MSEQSTGKKKVVRKESDPKKTTKSKSSEPVWTPTPEAKSKANKLRILAWVGWLVAIGVQIFAIFWILKQVPVNMVLLIAAIVVTGIFSIAGSMMWKQANRLDPASKEDAFRFWVQNQLGAIMAIISFLPLIIMIFMNKDMDSKQKGIAGGIGIAVLAIAMAFGISWESPSQEQYAAEQSIILTLTGKDEVFWTKSGKVFHVCEAVPDVNKESQDGQIYVGTVEEAHAAGKTRLVSYWDREAINYCGFTQEQVDSTRATIEAAGHSDLTDGEDSATPAA
ncbi:MAG: hypothetical protein M9953_03550 [Thermomicrobiales bacterium]|nr:hypothetical protein [Thermomicrobiales bacterium]MCO5218026.1 hypothetical protein [Thermomicrobiales bacterium]MCO5224393.1 hypothetical protein [Thermomicrobiales bacterium]MCO5228241.1 hypothetical protein [Thermomicrobiales bacterium]